jgi:hypothetical protein
MTKEKKLLSLISFLLIIGFMITCLASYYASLKSLRSEIDINSLPLTSDNIYSEIQRDLFRPVFISSLMANDTFLKDWMVTGEKGEKNIAKYLREIREKYHTYTSFLVSENTRNYYYADGILKKVDSKEPRDLWYFRVSKMAHEYEINVDRDLANSDAVTIFVNYRIHDYKGNYIGATGVGLTVNAVKILIKKYQDKYNRHIYFINKKGEVVLSGSGRSHSSWDIFRNKNYARYLDEIFKEQEKSFSYKYGSEQIHVNTRYISEFGWYLIVEQSEGETTRRIFATLMVNLGICALITSIVLVLVCVSFASYQKKIETLKGIVPICSYCKQIRDDKGYWQQVEAYIAEHTNAAFSHAICPKCMAQFHPEVDNPTEDK